MNFAEHTTPTASEATPPRPVAKAIRLAEFAAVLTEMRRTGVKPSPTVIDQTLQKRGFVPATDSRYGSDAKIVRLSDATTLPQAGELSGRSRKYESELDTARREIAALQQELAEYRKALPDLLRRESELLHQLDVATGNAVPVPAPTADSSELEGRLHDALAREAALEKRLAEMEQHAATHSSLADELENQRTLATEAGDREAQLAAQLETASSRALLTDKLEAELRELQAALEDFQKRESEWAVVAEQEAESRLLADSLSQKATAAELALKDSRQRQRRLEQEFADLHQRLRESQSGGAPFQAQLDEATRALDEARREAQLHAAGSAELRDSAIRAETALADARDREAELLAQLEAAALRASKAEEQLVAHTDQDTAPQEPLRAQLLLALESATGLRPEDASRQSTPESESAEALLHLLQDEIARAHEYRAHLEQELTRAQRNVGSEPGLSLRLESSELGKYLAEIIEVELHRQESTLAGLAQREIELRAQLEKAKPRSVRAQSIEAELTGSLAYRAEVERRIAAVSRVLRETIASLRTEAA